MLSCTSGTGWAIAVREPSTSQIILADKGSSSGLIWLPDPAEVIVGQHLVVSEGSGPFGVGLDLRLEASAAWHRVQMLLQDPADTVSRAVFFDFCCIQGDPIFGEYCDLLYDAAEGLVLPASVSGLDRHAFSYAALLLLEFPTSGKPPDRLGLTKAERPADALREARKESDKDWYAIPKCGTGHVGLEAFRLYFLAKFSRQLVPQSRPAYEAFLDRVFSCASALALPKRSARLDEHAFRYAALLCGEFDFEGARNAASGRHRKHTARDSLRLLAATPRSSLADCDMAL